MKILVIIVTYNAMKWVDRCFSSIQQSNIPLDAFIIDNGSTDGSVSYIKMHWPEFMLIESGQNLGFGKANNIGLKYALDNQYDYVYLLNQDAWIQPDTIDKLLTVSNNHSEFGILSPMQMEANMKKFDKNFEKNSLSVTQFFNDSESHELKECYETNSVMAAHWFMTESCLEKIGGFSSTFPHYGEDSNYLSRLHFHGLKVGIVPSAIGVHDREYRTIDQKKMFYMSCYIQYLHKISDLSANPWQEFFKMFGINIHYATQHHSLQPIRYILRIIKEIPQIIHNRSLSKKTHAFI